MDKKLLVALAALTVFLLAFSAKVIPLQIIVGPEGVDCSLYSAFAYGGIKVNGKTEGLTDGINIHSVIGQVNPGSWIAYKDYSDFGFWGEEYKRRIGYQWQRPDPKTPVVTAIIFDRDGNKVLEGINVQIRIRKPTIDEVNIHGDPLGRNPTQIDWYSYETSKNETDAKITWKHYEVYVVPVDFWFELSIRPTGDLDVGDFKDIDLWFVIDTVVWVNAFTYDQYILLKEKPPEGAVITAYNYRGAFPIWAWVGQWDPWVVSGREGDPNRPYTSADLTSEERAELELHLQLMPTFSGSEISLYTYPGYIYPRLFAASIIQNPELLKNLLSQQIPGLPDPRFAQTVYFPLTLINYGALKREGGWGPWYWHKEFYPTSYMRVRALYAIYGEWVYAWTKEEAEKQEYSWENRSSIIVNNPSEWDKFLGTIAGAFGAIGAWFANPINIFWMLLIVMVVIILVITILNPGVWSAIALALRR